MDFASLLSSQISKAKTETSSDSNKYLSRRQVEAQREAAYHAEQKKLEQERQAKLEKKRKFEEEEAARTHEREEKKRRLAEESKRRREEEEEQEERERRKRLGLPELPPKSDGDGETPIPAEEDVEDVEEDTLLRKLRALGEAAKLFGETHAQRLRRYKRLAGHAAPGPTLSTGPIPTTLALLPEAEMKVPAQVPQDEDARRFLFRQLASYFTMVLSEYERAMAARPDHVKASSAGRQAHSWMVLARENLRPLFRKMEKFELEDDVLKPVVEIVKAAQERRYVHANDAYLRLSIGKAAWPIGVTMVGIHERSAREKLHESSKESAHIMSDESTRKYLQSIKRCLTFAQTRWPPDDHMQMMG